MPAVWQRQMNGMFPFVSPARTIAAVAVPSG